MKALIIGGRKNVRRGTALRFGTNVRVMPRSGAPRPCVPPFSLDDIFWLALLEQDELVRWFSLQEVGR